MVDRNLLYGLGVAVFLDPLQWSFPLAMVVSHVGVFDVDSPWLALPVASTVAGFVLLAYLLKRDVEVRGYTFWDVFRRALVYVGFCWIMVFVGLLLPITLNPLLLLVPPFSYTIVFALALTPTYAAALTTIATKWARRVMRS
jgi:hypothetical protein